MAKKKSVKKKSNKKKSTKSIKTPEVENILVENFISLQKVMTNLSGKFDKLTAQMTKLLELFEVSAKSLAEKEVESKKDAREEKEIIEKLDNLLEQNKIIAKGLTLIHEGKGTPSMPRLPQKSFQRPPQPSAGMSPQQSSHVNDMASQAGGYQKSMGS